MHQPPEDDPTVRLSDSARDRLREDMREAVAAGLQAALDKEMARMFWAEGLAVLREQAARETGRFVLDGLATVARRALWILVLVVALYMAGGFRFVQQLWAALRAPA